MYISELVLEITRRCNIQCRHCLRGHAQGRNMAFETLRKALIGVDHIGTVTFTGGEPVLNVPFIRYFTEYVRDNKISVGGFIVFTNGKIASKSLKDALTRLAWFCDDNDMCGLYMSQDQFHKELGYSQWPAMNLYEELPFFHPDVRNGRIEYPIDEGLAFENGLGVRSSDANKIIVGVNEDGSLSCNEGTVYINVNGDVIPSCDLSYENQELEKIGSVYEKPLEDILKQFIHNKAEWLQEVA